MPDFWMRMEKADAGLTERATVLRDHVFSDGALPRCTKEGAIRFPDGIRIHARRALEHGATPAQVQEADRKSTRLNSSHGYISYAVFCLKKKKNMRSLLHLSIPHQKPTTQRSCPVTSASTRHITTATHCVHV